MEEKLHRTFPANSITYRQLLVDTKNQRVLFAEAGKDFVDFVFTLLSLPIGTVIQLLSNDGMVGSLGKLYGSVESLSSTYMQPYFNKESLLKPKSPWKSNCCNGQPCMLQFKHKYQGDFCPWITTNCFPHVARAASRLPQISMSSVARRSDGSLFEGLYRGRSMVGTIWEFDKIAEAYESNALPREIMNNPTTSFW